VQLHAACFKTAADHFGFPQMIFANCVKVEAGKIFAKVDLFCAGSDSSVGDARSAETFVFPSNADVAFSCERPSVAWPNVHDKHHCGKR
jgi:hypothetical protein